MNSLFLPGQRQQASRRGRRRFKTHKDIARWRTAAACRRSSIDSAGGLSVSSTLTPSSNVRAPGSPGHTEFAHAVVERATLEWNIGELRSPGTRRKRVLYHLELHPGQLPAEALTLKPDYTSGGLPIQVQPLGKDRLVAGAYIEHLSTV